ncbi:GGDEF domain-containing protein [Pseudomonas tohonis]|uniref:GGDEF domain-containing protein n=1 Tax=Pseudomonas tohonis TaxID=2725477 RepID=UPI0021D916A2|nr:GGDEF domain-containing protein [Pseudomonas tohonis]UXY55795.1 GGDEF domain-containing protein [Pseudomonas tohonis]
MQQPHHSPPGLEDADQRALVRLIFASTALTLACFSVLQFLAGNLLLSLLEMTTAALLGWACQRIRHVRVLTPWLYAYLLPTFSFLLYIIVMPGASPTAFVWIYLVPVLSYLLLGKLRGFLLAIPYLVLAVIAYLLRFPPQPDAKGLIDLGNAMLCGLLILAFMHIYEARRAIAHAQLRRLAQSDALTGVANRAFFQQALEQSIRDAERTGAGLVLVVLDIDDFKQVNDRWGHDAGDQALRHICQRLQQRLRATDLIGRLGGEEFGLLLGRTTRDDAARLVEELRHDLQRSPLRYGEHGIPLSATFGLAEWRTDGHSGDELYRRADKRLYQGKAQGRNRLVISDCVP